MKVIVAQLGARMHYAIPRMLEKSGMLSHLYTDICAIKGWPKLLNILIPKKFLPKCLKRLLGRVPYGVPASRITAFTNFGLQYALARLNSRSKSKATSVYIRFGKEFCERIVSKGWGNASAVYAYNSAGLELFKEAKKSGLIAIMEQTSAPRRVERKILDDASKLYPEWIENEVTNFEMDEFALREEAEWNLADLILCGSEYVRQGILACGGPVKKCVVVPYGVDLNFFNNKNQKKHSGPLRVLTVGALNLQKGTPITVEAAKQLKGICEFRMVGECKVNSNLQSYISEHVDYIGAVPRSKIREQYEWADVFLLPSLSEGSATVTYEAMASGLPVICTPNTGSIVKDGINGILVPILSVESVVHALNNLASNPSILIEYKKSLIDSKSYIGLDAYQNRVIQALKEA